MGHNCIVRGCRSEWYPGCGLKFHYFPRDSIRRKIWLSIVPLKSKFYENGKICSLHFKQTDYRGNRLLETAKPSFIDNTETSEMVEYEQSVPEGEATIDDISNQLLMCRGCFATGVKLFDLQSMDLKSTFEEFVGKTKVEEVAHCLCSCCASLLVKFTQFRDRCRRAEDLLQELRDENMLNTSIVKSIDRPFYKLNSNMTISKPTHVQTDITLGIEEDTNLNKKSYTVLIDNRINIKLETEAHEEFDDGDNATLQNEDQPEIKTEHVTGHDQEYQDDSHFENPVRYNRRCDTAAGSVEEESRIIKESVNDTEYDQTEPSMDCSPEGGRYEEIMNKNYSIKVANLPKERAQSAQIGKFTDAKRIPKRHQKQGSRRISDYKIKRLLKEKIKKDLNVNS